MECHVLSYLGPDLYRAHYQPLKVYLGASYASVNPISNLNLSPYHPRVMGTLCRRLQIVQCLSSSISASYRLENIVYGSRRH